MVTHYIKTCLIRQKLFLRGKRYHTIVPTKAETCLKRNFHSVPSDFALVVLV